VHKFHRFHTLTKHFYISRPIFVNRTAFDAWPRPLQRALREAVTDAVAFHRALHEQEEADARKAIEAAGGEIAELTVAEHAAFVDAVKLLREEARAMYGDELLGLAQP